MDIDTGRARTRSALTLVALVVGVAAIGSCRRSLAEQSTGAVAPAPTATPPAAQRPIATAPGPGKAVSGSPAASAAGSLLVRSRNEHVRLMLGTDRPGVNPISFIAANQPLDLVPWDYTIMVNQSMTRRTVRAGERTTVTLASLVVAGAQGTSYSVLERGGRALASLGANQPIDLVPGDFIVQVNGSSTPVSLRDGEAATVDTGSLVVTSVASGGKATEGQQYRVRDTSQQVLAAAAIGAPLDLLPGDYVVDLSGSRMPQRVRVGQRSTVLAGALVVASQANDRSFFVRTEGETSAWGNGQRVHLLPGVHSVVTADGRLQSVTVVAGQTTTVR